MKLDSIAKEVLCIQGGFSVGCLCIYIDCGANNEHREKSGISGISHLCEHLFIKLLKKQYLKKKSDNNFSCMGFTDYMYTIIVVTFTENFKNLIDLIAAINITDSALDIGEIYFSKCKKEVLKECIERKEEIKRSLKVNSFITNDVIDYVPVGNVEIIKKLDYKTLKKFFINNYCEFRCAFLLENSFFLKNYYRKSVIYDRYKIKELTSKNPRCIISKQNKLKIYFLINNDILTLNIILSLLEYILSYKIKNILGFDVYFMKKKISESYVYEILCLGNGSEEAGYNILRFIKNYQIKENDMLAAQNKLINQLYIKPAIDLNYAINNIINYFVYGENIMLNENQIQNARFYLRQVKLHQLQSIKTKTFENNYTIIIGI